MIYKDDPKTGTGRKIESIAERPVLRASVSL